MPEIDPLTYTVTPGPAVLARMGQSWTLHLTDGAPVMFSHGEDGEKPGPVTLSLTSERAEELRRDGYEVEGEKLPEPAVDPIPPDEAAFLEEAGDPVPDAGPGIAPIGPPKGAPGESAIPPGSNAFTGIVESMDGEPGEGVQIHGGQDADGHPAEPVKQRKR